MLFVYMFLYNLVPLRLCLSAEIFFLGWVEAFLFVFWALNAVLYGGLASVCACLACPCMLFSVCIYVG